MAEKPADAGLPPLSTDKMNRAVELARRTLRERGYSEQQIDALLERKRIREVNTPTN